MDNFKKIKEMAKTVNFKLALNDFADLTNKEFNKIYNGSIDQKNKFKVSKTVKSKRKLKCKKIFKTKSKNKIKTKRSTEENFNITQNIDWRDKGAVLPPRHQKNCGSCYAFAVLGALEALFYNQTGELVYLSPQNILDCTRGHPYRNLGCVGGYLDKTLNFIKENGISTDTAYPYETSVGTSCQSNSKKALGELKGYVEVEDSEIELQKAVAKGPVIIGMEASLYSFQFYAGGIYSDVKCQISKTGNHAVVLIGYGIEDDGHKYWLIKNSYGTKWGMKGYGKISRDHPHFCAIGSAALSVY